MKEHFTRPAGCFWTGDSWPWHQKADFSGVARGYDPEWHLGCLDAPHFLAAGSTVAEEYIGHRPVRSIALR